MDEKINDTHRLILERRKKLNTLKDNGNNYSNDFKGNSCCAELISMFDNDKIVDNEEEKFIIMGRMMSKRIMGRSSFANIKDESGNIQFYVDKKKFSEKIFKIFKDSDFYLRQKLEN